MKELLLFSTVPVSIEIVTSIRTANTIHLMVTLAIHAFEDIRTRLSFFGSYLIHFLVFYATPHFLSVVLGNVGSIALGTPGDMRATAKCRISPLPTVLTLRDTWVHVGTFNSSNEPSNVKATIDNVLRQRTTLGIPDVHLDHCHV